ncbi:hypothetical protein PoB_003337900 [Plakobranchus ocellatus]|uniref:Uncharacterized protein n=1 Tax=Plakobranchus ocellatus TaxID=259542 RepID=A0AAV4AGR8_9GAST|nr:hypothetical protein PoB_003337900 [Plakobranchus ocellatus]
MMGQVGLLTELMGQFGMLTELVGQFGWLTEVVGHHKFLTELVGQHDLLTELIGPPSGQGAGGGAQTRDRGVPVDFRADSLTTVPPTSHYSEDIMVKLHFCVQHSCNYQ